MLIARIYKHGCRKTWPEYALHSVHINKKAGGVLFSGRKCGTAGGGRNWPSDRSIQWP